LVATCIYLNILWLSTSITGIRQSWEVWVLAAAAILLFQIGGAIVDIKSDRVVGKITFAAWVGESWASRALSAVVAAKGVFLLAAFSALVPAGLNLLAVPFCLARPSLSGYHWSAVAYFNFVVIDWVALGLLAKQTVP
jgi:1,4-dihydroxy-2-naphthoate octaprenyltransferase